MILRGAVILAAALPILLHGKPLPIFYIDTDKRAIHRTELTLSRLAIEIPVIEFLRLRSQPENTSWQSIMIRRRGMSSDSFAKKQYQIKFVDEAQKSLPTAVLGFPAASKWILNGPFVDRSLLRNHFGYEAGQYIGSLREQPWFAMKSQLVEVFLNQLYQGVYLLIEKIDEKRIPLQKIDINQADREPSFIIEINSGKWEWKTAHDTYIRWKYPKAETLEKWFRRNPSGTQRIIQSIQKSILDFELSLAKKTFLDPTDGYKSHIDIDSFVDYFLIQEIFKNVDGYRRSTYLSRNGAGPIQMGPIWDFNLAMGNLTPYKMYKTNGWLFKRKRFYDGNQPVFWFRRLVQDPAFVSKVQQRYAQLRQNFFNTDSILEWFATKSDILGEAAYRNEQRWKKTKGFLESYVFNSPQFEDDFNSGYRKFKNWIIGRLEWMDHHISKL